MREKNFCLKLLNVTLELKRILIQKLHFDMICSPRSARMVPTNVTSFLFHMFDSLIEIIFLGEAQSEPLWEASLYSTVEAYLNTIIQS